MRRAVRLSTLIGPAAAALVAGSPAHSQITPPIDAAQSAADEDATSPPRPDEPAETPRKKVDLLIAPVPFSSPTTGTGLAGGAIAFYNPNNGPHQWISGGGIVWTSLGTKGAALFHTMSLDQDRVRVNVTASYFDAKEKFYGIGGDAGDRGDMLQLDNRKTNLQLQAQMRIFPHGYIGLRYRLVDTNATPDEEAPAIPAPPADQRNSTISMLGLTVAYDTRDSQTQPHQGLNLNASWIFGTRAFGDSFEHNKLALAGSVYMPLGKTVVAANAALCSVGGTVPYYDLCLFGSGGVLRGYLSGRYRDRASWAMQGELRYPFGSRWGGVAFVGLGGIAPSVGDFLTNGDLLPAGGVGVRYRPFKNNDVHLRLDLAIGKNDPGVYLGISEAF